MGAQIEVPEKATSKKPSLIELIAFSCERSKINTIWSDKNCLFPLIMWEKLRKLAADDWLLISRLVLEEKNVYDKNELAERFMFYINLEWYKKLLQTK